MKHWLEDYKKVVREWDKTHRLIGQESIDALIKQSTEALSSFSKQNTPPNCLVDVGAGSGLLGIAWLALSESHEAIFVEPRPKASAFILYICSTIPGLKERALILPQKLEDVSRETVTRFSLDNFWLASRAFSGPVDLEQVLAQSQFPTDSFYVFATELADSQKPQYVLKKLR